jgi:hypothetical protein
MPNEKRVEIPLKDREISAGRMDLDEAQRKQVAEWIRQGLKLSEIQSKLNAEFGQRLTYMEVRLLVDDLKLTPKDVERPKPAAALSGAAAPPPPAPAARAEIKGAKAAEAAPAAGQVAAGMVTLSVDQLARPGAVVSGKVTFSDGNRAEWYLDQAGRLGLVTEKQGYRPPAADVQQFQAALEAELSRMGM